MENVRKAVPRNEAEVLGERMDSQKGSSEESSTAEPIARRSYGKLVAFVAARTSNVAAAEDVPLAEQDQTLWNSKIIFEAEALLRRASGLGYTGRYQLEAALQSAQVFRWQTGHANWAEGGATLRRTVHARWFTSGRY